MTWLIIIPVVLLAVIIGLYNKLVRDRNRMDEAWSGIDVQLKRRHDLVPSLVEVVKGYAQHESSVMEDVTSIRTTGSPSNELAGQENQLSQSIGKLMLLAEEYPDLKANENYQQLSDQLVEIEDTLQRARRYYNGSVRNLNIRIQTFPSNLVANAFGFKEQDFFEIKTASERINPKVQLSDA